MQATWIIGGALGLFALYMFGVDPRWIAAFGVAWLGLSFNSIVGLRSRALAAQSSVEVAAKKRFDLIPALIDTVQRHIEHESDLLTELTELRAAASGPQTAALDQQTSSVFSRFIATAENYPELRSSQSFQELGKSLNECEEQLSAARRSYNMAAKYFNDALHMFPSNLFASVMRYQPLEYFDAPEIAMQPVDVMQRFRSHQDAA